MKNCRILYLFCGLFLASCSPQTVEHDLLISNVNIIDVKTGEVLPNRSVAVDSNVISAIYQEEVQPNDSTIVVNATDQYLIPGLWDMHTHYHWNHQDSNPLLIANGIIGLRDMWGDISTTGFIRKQAKAGKMVAPDIYTSGIIIDGNPPARPGTQAVSNAREARVAVIEQINQGVDFIKIYSRLSPESFQAIAETAKEHDIQFAGHIPFSVSIRDAAISGMASAEHMYGVLLGSSSREDSLRLAKQARGVDLPLLTTFDQQKFDALCQVLAEKELWMCPTLTVLKALGHLKDTSFITDERLKYVPDYIKYNWNFRNLPRFRLQPDAYFAEQKEVFKFQQNLLGRMADNGVKFIAGTDYPNPYCFPGFSLHDELALMVEGGMDELTALQTATINPAIFMNKEEDFGTVEEGKLASLLLLNQNPLEDISHTQSIAAVILRGQLFESPVLDQWLEDVATDLEKPSYADWLRKKVKQDGLSLAMDSTDIILQNNPGEYRLSEIELNMIGYEFLSNDQPEIAIAIFKENVDLFPESYNVYDSYAVALFEDQQYAESLENYRKSLELNPHNLQAKMMIDSIADITHQKRQQ